MTSTSLRKPIRHLHTATHKELVEWFPDYRLSGTVTEKTDGMAFEVGYDELGFFSRTSHSVKMRQPGDYVNDAYNRFGSNIDPTISSAFAHLHYSLLQLNFKLKEYLRQNHTSISGEVFYRQFGKPVDVYGRTYLQFVGTAYNMKNVADLGMFVVHSAVNPPLDYSQFTTDQFTWDTDLVAQSIEFGIDIDLMTIEQAQYGMGRIYDYILNTFKPKWGPETEGYVIHPFNSAAPMLKVIDPAWSERRKRIK